MSRVAKRYAKALFAQAKEDSLLNEVGNDLTLISTLNQQSDDFRLLLSNPIINEKDKVRVLLDMFQGKVQNLTLDFLNLLSEKRRIPFLPQMAEEFRLMMLAYAGEVEGELISAQKLSEKQVDKIKAKIEHITGKTVFLTEKIDKTVLGGFIVKVEDWVLDNSIRYQLVKLREQLAAR